MVMVKLSGQMVLLMKGNGKIIEHMDSVSSSMLLVMYTRASGIEIKLAEKESTKV